MAYGQGTNTINNTATGDNNVDALIAEKRWRSNRVTFSFTNNFTNDYEDGGLFGWFGRYANYDAHRSSFSTLNNNQRRVMRQWTQMYEDVSNLNLVELTGNSDRDATIRIAESNHPSTAYAYLPDSSVEAGDVWFNRSDFNRPVMGNYAYYTFGHELGHALGLEHGHEMNGIRNVRMNSNRDSMEFSIMTYRSYEGAPTNGVSNETWGYAQSLMMYDIRAIQHMYGADFGNNSGNTNYTFSTTTGEMFINGVGQGTPGGNRVFRTIWDGNGIDTYSFTNYTTDLSIDLTPGGWTNLDTNGNFQKVQLDDDNNIFARGHVFNALQYYNDSRSLIENANGGYGDDSIKGNSAANVLRGGWGDDTLVGGAGRDSLYGGDDNDKIYSDGDGGSYFGENGNDRMYSGLGGETMNGGSGIDTIYHVSYDGNYTFDMATGATNWANESFVNFENAVMGEGNDSVTGNASNNIIEGRGGDDTLVGGTGRDTLIGGGDNDTIYSDGDGGSYFGEDGDDLMYSGLGTESMNGGTGIDTIDHTAYDGNYRFNMANGYTNWLGESFTNFENVVMGDGNDNVVGNSLANSINGGKGSDTLTGAGGADDFVFDSLSHGIDTITDFSWSQNDEIHISDKFGGGLTEGFLLSSQFTIGFGAADLSDRIIYNSTNGDLFFDADGSGRAAQVQFASLDSGLALIASDFVVV